MFGTKMYTLPVGVPLEMMIFSDRPTQSSPYIIALEKYFASKWQKYVEIQEHFHHANDFRKCEHHYSLQFQPTIKCSPLLCSKKRLSGNIVSLSWASTCSADLMSFYRGDKRACWCWLKASREVFARFWAVWNVWDQFTRTFTLSLGRLSLGLIHKPHKLVGDGET